MSETDFHEDGDGSAFSAYGHRFYDPMRTLPRPNRDNDRFLDTPESGCRYRGTDAPGMGIGDDESVQFHLEFRAGPFDSCSGIQLPGWHEWVSEGTFIRPPPLPPTPTPGPTPGPSGGGGAPIHVTPRPYRGTIGANFQVSYAGGIPPTAAVGEHYDLRVQFVIDGQVYQAPVPVEVHSVSADEIVVRTTNGAPINIAPEGKPAVVVRPNALQPIPRRWL
jgi:hypothetical protein